MDNNITYKKTEIGLIPFDWEVIKLNDLGATFSGLSGKNKEDFGSGSPYIPYKNIFQNSRIDINYMDYVQVKNNEKQNQVKYGDLFFTVSSETVNEIGMTSVLLDEVVNLYLNSFCFGFRLHNFNRLNPFFSSYLFRGETVRRKIIELAQGSTRFNLSKQGLLKLLLYLPPIYEQQKIAEILTVWDIAINTSKSTLEELIKQKKWLAYNLLFNRKMDSKNESNNLVPLSKLLNRVKNPFTPDPQKYYKQIGIRSHTKGIFYKDDVSGLSLGNKSVFHIEPNCFILNIVFAWEHAIAKTTLNEVGMIASHRFPMFKPVPDKLDLDYLLHFFKSQKGKDLLGLASPGGAGRNKTLGQSDFLKLKIPVPNIKEQKIIAEVLDKAGEEILLYKEKIANLQLQKKGLMQQLLTGKVRVKI